jgi:hypothetical protein
MSQADDSPPELRGLLDGLADPDPARQEAALRELRDRASKKGLTKSDGAFLLRAAGKEYPPMKDNPTNCIAAELIRAVASTPDRSYVAIVREIFGSLRLPSRPWGLGDPRTAALDLLAQMDDEAAAHALLDLLEQSVAAGSSLDLPVGNLRGKSRLAQVYFPRMLESATGKPASDVFLVCFEYARKGLLSPEQLAPHAGVLVDAYARIRPVIDVGPSDSGYEGVRDTAALLLDLMGYFASPEVEPTLNAATKLADLTLAGYAACALIRLGRSSAPSSPHGPTPMGPTQCQLTTWSWDWQNDIAWFKNTFCGNDSVTCFANANFWWVDSSAWYTYQDSWFHATGFEGSFCDSANFDFTLKVNFCDSSTIIYPDVFPLPPRNFNTQNWSVGGCVFRADWDARVNATLSGLDSQARLGLAVHRQ